MKRIRLSKYHKTAKSLRRIASRASLLPYTHSGSYTFLQKNTLSLQSEILELKINLFEKDLEMTIPHIYIRAIQAEESVDPNPGAFRRAVEADTKSWRAGYIISAPQDPKLLFPLSEKGLKEDGAPALSADIYFGPPR